MTDQNLNNSSIKRVFRRAGIINLLLAVLLFLVMHLAMGWNAMVLMDRYSECYNRGIGIISVDKLQEFHNGAYADADDSLALLEKFLLPGLDERLSKLLLFFSVLVAANGAFLIWKSFRMPKVREG